MENNAYSVIADLHIHSRFSRATSKNITISNLVKYAKIKGLGLLGTGDFTHSAWLDEIKQELKEDENGILWHNYNDEENRFPFVWQTEISLMYSQDEKGRRVHHVILAPNGEIVRQVIDFLASKGRLDYDGRPIFGFSSIELVDAMQSISSDIEIIPAHCMTPWFGIFGSKSGFDSLKECFQDKTDKIHAVESGLSADPEMLWKFPFLDNKSILSFSDLHSFWPWRIGRESTIFNLSKDSLSYKDIIKQIRVNSFRGTIEVDPAYGKYHWDGHRNCDFSCSPEETKKLGGICPKCKQQLTIGVEYRVEELAEKSRPTGFRSKNAKLYYKLLPLHELIALAKASTLSSRKTWQVYNSLIEKFGNEFNILLNVSKEQMIKEKVEEKLIDLIIQNREAKLRIKPGFDGTYGEIMLKERQTRLV